VVTLDRHHPKPMTPPAPVMPVPCFAKRLVHELSGPLDAS
jgi:hypothetical protein